MAPRRNPKSGSPGPGGKRETKHGGSKNGKKEGLSGSSFFTWFMVIALLGVWTSVAVVWFELVDYEEVLAKAKDFRYNLSEVLQGKLGIYDADGDGDFDVDDAKILLGLTKDGSNENIDSLEEVLNILAEESSDWFYGFLSFLYDVMTPFEILEEEESDATDDVDGYAPGEVAKKKAKGLKERSVPEQPTQRDAEEFRTVDLPHAKEEPEHAEAEPEYEMDEMDSLLHEILKSQIDEASEDSINQDIHFRDDEENNEISEDTVEAPTLEDDYEDELDYKMPEIIETPDVPESFQEEPASDYEPGQPEQDETHVSYEYHSNGQENTHEPETHEPEGGKDYRELTLEDALEHNTEPLPEASEQHDYVEEHDLENEILIETRDIDGEPLTEHYYGNVQDEADASDSVTEHTESVDEREEAKVHVNEQPRETEVPVQAEDYSNDDLVDT